MAIRPIDVRRKEFSNGFRGYDANQVDDFLDQVADEFERAYTDNQRMKEEISSLRDRLEQFEDLEGSIRSALVHAEQAANDLRNSAQREADDLRNSAQREADTLRSSSQKEAELTMQEAQSRSHQMLSDSSGRVDRVQDSYEALQEAKRGFTNDFRQLLKTYMDVMEDMEISTAKGIESSLRRRLDTESITVAREAAAQDQPTLTDDEGPLYEDDEASEPAGEPDPSSGNEETQRIDLEDLPDRADTDPETEEPEVAASTSEGEVDARDTGTGDSAAEEVDREEPSLGENQAADDFFDRERNDSGREEENNNRIFRASRFLRRRG